MAEEIIAALLSLMAVFLLLSGAGLLAHAATEIYRNNRDS
jgi:hypothetical protein